MSSSAHKKRSGVYVSKGPKESNEKLVSRFQKKVQGSRVLIMGKELMYHKPRMTKDEIRTRAIMREHFRAVREKQKYL